MNVVGVQDNCLALKLAGLGRIDRGVSGSGGRRSGRCGGRRSGRRSGRRGGRRSGRRGRRLCTVDLEELEGVDRRLTFVHAKDGKDIFKELKVLCLAVKICCVSLDKVTVGRGFELEQGVCTCLVNKADVGAVHVQVLAGCVGEAVLAVLVNSDCQNHSAFGNGHLAVRYGCCSGFKLIFVVVHSYFACHDLACTGIIDHDLITGGNGIYLSRGGRSLSLCEYGDRQGEYHGENQQQRKQFLCALHFVPPKVFLWFLRI